MCRLAIVLEHAERLVGQIRAEPEIVLALYHIIDAIKDLEERYVELERVVALVDDIRKGIKEIELALMRDQMS